MRLAGRGGSALAEVASPLYHALGHVIPALAVHLTRPSALASITAVWLPLGILVVALGLFGLGRALAGVGGGTLALVFWPYCPIASRTDPAMGFCRSTGCWKPRRLQGPWRCS